MATSAPAWAFGYADDFLIVDGLETVHLLRQSSAGAYAGAVEVRAVRENPDKNKTAGLMEASDIIFHLFAPDVGEDGVRPGDRIEDYTGDQYSVNGAGLGGVFDTWRCPSTKVPA